MQRIFYLTQRRNVAKQGNIRFVFAPLRLCALIACALLPNWLIAAEPASKTNPLEVQSVVLRLLAEADVPAQEAGVLTNVAVREGDDVKQGATLAQIDDQVARMAELAAKLKYDVAHEKATNDVQVRYAQKAAEVAEAELERSTGSVARFAKSVSQTQLDVERLNVEKTRLEAEQADHNQQIAALEMKTAQNELDAAKVQRVRRQIVAPFDGTIVQVFVRLGEWVEPGQKALRIVNTKRLKAEGFLPATMADAKLLGAPVRLTLDLAGEDAAAFTGKVSFVSPEVDPITGQVRVWAEIDNQSGRLRPGQPVKMMIESPHPSALSHQ
jgi:macrolide-specific efflux system membrane fusion protein